MALFPPIVASSMPAFDINSQQIKIYFTLSNYNSQNVEDIKAVHLTARVQSSNKNALGTKEILNFVFEQNNYEAETNRYYINFPTSCIDDIKPNVLYKIQLRFSSISRESKNESDYSFFSNYINSFSEWSTVCLIKPINRPKFYLNEFEDGTEQNKVTSKDVVSTFSNLADFIGIYDPVNSSETLKYWRLRLLNNSFIKKELPNIDDYTLSDSGIIAVSANNYTLDSTSLALDCSLNYEFRQTSNGIKKNSDSGPNYKLYFEITTKNGYHEGKLYSILYVPQLVNKLSGILKAYVNNEEGYVKLDFEGEEIEYLGNLVLRRSDSTNNFAKWEDLKNFEVNGSGSFTYYDFTIESGIFYKYLVQKRDSRGRRGTPVYCQSIKNDMGIFVEYDHPFLLEATGNGDLDGTKQLKLKYDFQISSYKTNISESKVDTLGSQYPFIRRNGSMYYRSFPITGIITEYMDQASLLTNTSEMFDGYYNYYKNYRANRLQPNLSQPYDYITERKFREKVEEFLYNSKPKLYKSTQEGNIFIKLMQVSLTPKNELGRLVYSFSATAYEIDKANIENFNKYKLIEVGEYSPIVQKTQVELGRLSGYVSLEGNLRKPFKGGCDIIRSDNGSSANVQTVESKIGYKKIRNNYLVNGYTITWLRIEVDQTLDTPYLIKKGVDGRFTPYYTRKENSEENTPYWEIVPDFQNITYPLYQMEEQFSKPQQLYLGWLFQINGTQIIISWPNTVYEIKESNFAIDINSLIPAKDTYMDIDYEIIKHIETDPNTEPKKISVFQTNGQILGTFSSSTNIITKIYRKYQHSYYDDEGSKVKKYCNGIKNICIDTEPGTKIQIRTSSMTTTDDSIVAIVNETGILEFEPGGVNTYITSFKILGQRFYTEDFYDLDPILARYNYLSNLEESQSYIIQEVTDKQDNLIAYDINCPVSAMIFYLAKIRRDTY